MKKLFFGLIAVAALSFTSCKDECKDVNCANGGTCDAGVCSCPSGYEGELCETETRAKILGTYQVSENCDSTGSATYNVTITAASSDVTKVLISPFGGYTGVTATCTLNGSSLTLNSISGSNISFSNLSGTVSANGGTISNVTYTVSASSSETCPGTWTKQ